MESFPALSSILPGTNRKTPNSLVSDSAAESRLANDLLGSNLKPIDLLECVMGRNSGPSDSTHLKALHEINARQAVAVQMGNPQGGQSSWKDQLFRPVENQGRMALEFIPPMVLADRIVVSPPPEVEALGKEKWKCCLVGHFLDKNLPFPVVRSIAMKIWKKSGLRDVRANGHGFFFFLFEEEGELGRVLDGGPWFFGGRMLILKKWMPQMELVKERMQVIPIWVHFHNVPLEYWTAQGLSHIASAVGKPLYADEMTKKCQRLTFAKVCVEVDLNSTFPSSFELLYPSGDSVTVEIKYPWHPLKCLHCKVFGHSGDHCPARTKEALVVATEGMRINGSADVGRVTTPTRVSTSPTRGPSSPAVVGAPGSSIIQVCDGAAIEKVVAQYGGGSPVVNATTPFGKGTMTGNSLPAGDELGDIGFVSSPAGGKSRLVNKPSSLEPSVGSGREAGPSLTRVSGPSTDGRNMFSPLIGHDAGLDAEEDLAGDVVLEVDVAPSSSVLLPVAPVPPRGKRGRKKGKGNGEGMKAKPIT